MPVRAPGRGASLLAPARGQYVYVVRSRRTGEISVGVDLTPNGACPLACDYCQVARVAPSVPEPVDVDGVAVELSRALEELAGEAGDVVFAGSGEPTWPEEFPSVLALARAEVARLRRPIPVRVFTSGATLDRPPVARSLEALVWSGGGELWVKLDAWDEATHRRFWGVHGQAAHEERVAGFGRHVPVVLQIMLVHRPGDGTLGATASGVAGAVGRLVDLGCRIDRVMLSTLFRPPGDGQTALSAYDAPAMAIVAEAIRARAVPVVVPAMGLPSPSLSP